MPVIRVLENVTFYTMFQLEPVGSRWLMCSCAEPRLACCVARGNSGAVLHARFGVKDHRTADGRFSWEEVECMGACANAPMVAIHDYYYEDLTPELALRAARQAGRRRDSRARLRHRPPGLRS